MNQLKFKIMEPFLKKEARVRRELESKMI